MADFDAWQQNPYTKVLQASIANDYVPKGDAQLYEQRLRAVLDVVQRYLPPDGIDMDTAMGEIIGLVDPWPAGVMASPPALDCCGSGKQDEQCKGCAYFGKPNASPAARGVAIPLKGGA